MLDALWMTYTNVIKHVLTFTYLTLQRIWETIKHIYIARHVVTLGENIEINIEDDEIDNYQANLMTERPPDVEWDLNFVQQPGKEQKVTKVVEQVLLHALLLTFSTT